MSDITIRVENLSKKYRIGERKSYLAFRDVAVRYKQTAIGIAWALIRPFLTMVVLTIVFNKVAKIEAPGALLYALFVFGALLIVR